MRTTDPETGYIGMLNLGKDFGKDCRCTRCGGRGMWKLHQGIERGPEYDHVCLCLRCADDWSASARSFLDKHGYKDPRSKKKWLAAFDEFCTTEPSSPNIAAHNSIIQQADSLVHREFPELFQ